MDMNNNNSRTATTNSPVGGSTAQQNFFNGRVPPPPMPQGYPNGMNGSVPPQGYPNGMNSNMPPQGYPNGMNGNVPPQGYPNGMYGNVPPQGYPNGMYYNAPPPKKTDTKVIVIAVIAVVLFFIGPIMAAIAIPVITTTINSSKLSEMEADTATVNLLVKEAINTYKAGITSYTYNGQTAAEATVGDVLTESGIDYSTDFFERDIGGHTYSMKWSHDTNEVAEYNDYDYSNSENTEYISEYTMITDLAD